MSSHHSSIVPQTPTEVIRKLATHQDGGRGWSVFIYYLNNDLNACRLQGALYGLVVPCGSYRSREEAERVRDSISIATNAPKVVLCQDRRPHGLVNGLTDQTLVYSRNEREDLKTIESSIEKEKERRRGVQERLQKEIEEREDPESLSHLINILYRLSTNDERIDFLQERHEEVKVSRDNNLQDVLSFARRNPDLFKRWREEAEQRFLERGETHVLERIEKGVERYSRQIREAIGESHERPSPVGDETV